MTYDWSALVFVERWRARFVRGVIFGMYRPADQTTFDLRFQPGGWATKSGNRAIEARLIDVGDLIRERRVPLTATVSAIVQVTARDPVPTERPEAGIVGRPEGRTERPRLEPGVRLAGQIEEIDGESRALVDVGFPLVVDFEAAPDGQAWSQGDRVEFDIAPPLRGYLLVS